MKNFGQPLPLTAEECLIKRAIVIGVVIMTTLSFTALGQTAGNQAVPLADHHTHVWSLNASTLVTEPLLPVVELPEELERLLRDKERFGGKTKTLRPLPTFMRKTRWC